MPGILSEPPRDARVKSANLEKRGQTLASHTQQLAHAPGASALGVIFDVDGVLVDSYEAHYESWAALAKEAGAAFSREAFTRTFGRTSREVIRECWPANIIKTHGVAALDDRKEAIFRALIEQHVPIMPGAPALLDALANAGFRLALGSSAPPANIELVRRALDRDHLFSACITGRDVSRGKPDPEVFQLAAERMAVSPANCAVVEDAPAGIEAAHRAGMKAIGFVSTGRNARDLADADLVVTSMDELDAPRIRSLISAGGRGTPSPMSSN